MKSVKRSRRRALVRAIIETLESRQLLSGEVVSSLSLLNADTGQPIAGYEAIADGATINLLALPTARLTIAATTSPATVGSVRFNYDGNDSYKIETYAPYDLAGDTLNDDGSVHYNAWTPTQGSHTLIVTPYDAVSGTGNPGTAMTVHFNVIAEGTQRVYITSPVNSVSEAGAPNPGA